MASLEASPIFWAKMRLSNWFASHITGQQGGRDGVWWWRGEAEEFGGGGGGGLIERAEVE